MSPIDYRRDPREGEAPDGECRTCGPDCDCPKDGDESPDAAALIEEDFRAHLDAIYALVLAPEKVGTK